MYACEWCCGAWCCVVWRRWCSGRRRARPPARSPHTSLRLGVVDLEARPCPPDPPSPSTPAAPGVLMVFEVRPGPATAHGHRSLAPLPPSDAAGDSRETVNTFAGVCTVSGETNDTIASQIHLLLALFHRAKASWVSYRRPDLPTLVLTVTSCGAVSSMGATKSAQHGLSLKKARKYSPSAGKMARNGHFIACWASFFASVGGWGVCWANFGALRHLNQVPRPSTDTEAGPFHVCLPSDRQNLPRTRIGYCDRDRLSASGQPIRMGPGVVLARSLRRRSWGFCTTRSCAAACHRRVGPSCSAIPPDQPCAQP